MGKSIVEIGLTEQVYTLMKQPLLACISFVPATRFWHEAGLDWADDIQAG